MKVIRWLAPLVALFLLCAAAAPGFVSAQGSIQITRPQSGAVVTSPLLVGGLTAQPTDSLNFRVRGALSGDLGAGSFPVKSPFSAPFDFTGEVTFNTPRPGEALFIDIFGNDGTMATVAVVAPGAPPPPVPQQIVITSPPSGTTIGSPVTLTGTTARMPVSNGLTFTVTNAQGQTITQGGFPVTPSGNGGEFVTSILFPVPPQGGVVRFTLTDRNPATNSIDATTSIDLVTQSSLPPTPAPPPPPGIPTPTPRPPQQIVIESPEPGESVTSPLTLRGYSIVFPINGTLNYTLATQDGVALAAGTFPVQTTGQQIQFVPFTFNVPITFSAAPGTPLILTVFDQDPATGAIPMSVGINLIVAGGAPSGSIVGLTIDSPPPNANVTLPGTVFGRTDLYPNGGNLSYRVLDGAGRVLVDGTIPVRASFLQPVIWNVFFNYSNFSGPVVLQVFALDPATGAVMESASRVYFVGGQ